MIRAYDEMYLDDAMKNLGEAFDYAVNACRLEADGFLEFFIASGTADQFGKGNPRYVSGMSGTELAMEVIQSSGLDIILPEALTDYECSPEYWSGWILAYYQWRSGRTFSDIQCNIPIKEILKLYPTLHEAAEEKFADTVNSLIAGKKTPAKIQIQRKMCGYSQKELAERSGVNLRTLQQYELKTKDICKASVSSVLALANALGCRIEDILEYSTGDIG